MTGAEIIKKLRLELERRVPWAGRFGARLSQRGGPALPACLLALAVAATTIRGILAQCGHAAVPLDDAYIHFQYAKRLATGFFFSYSGTETFSSGATSLLWPIALAPFYALGLRDVSIIWAAWLLSWMALVGLSIETYRLGERLAGRAPSLGAAAMVLCFAGYAWFASSGMEVLPFAYVLALTARLAAQWGESPLSARSAKTHRWLVLLALVGPLVRPEGALATVIVLATLTLYPPAPDATPRRARLMGLLLAVGGLAALPVVNLLFTGRAASSTTVAKWLIGNPYYARWSDLYVTIADHARLLVMTLLDGREWSALFLPAGSRPFALAALVAIPIMGLLRSKTWRAALVLALALGIFIPCTYSTFLWNRLRYLWPFAFAWFVGIACLGRICGDLLGIIRPRFRAAAGVLVGMAAGTLASRLGWSMDDVAVSSSAIDRQQVVLGRWAAEHLPKNAIIGVNDTGAIAYLSDRQTFDVVGLTTPGEATYWVAGAGSRFEHYERLHRTTPERLPTHFIVYPAWMACDVVLGDRLFQATVTNQSILGGTSMMVYEARYDLLGSGDLPAIRPDVPPLDELDVADLESEKAHHYELGATKETANAALVFDNDEEDTIADGARTQRTFDRFELHAKEGAPATIVGRWTAERATHIEVLVNGSVIGALEISEGAWTEESVAVPAELAQTTMRIEVRGPSESSRFSSAHYWVYPGSAFGGHAGSLEPSRHAND